MKYLNEFKIFESRESIEAICVKYAITNYTINQDMSIDVDDVVNLSHQNLTKLPLKFGKVNSAFYCHSNDLTSLEFCPTHVSGNFHCNENSLTSLEGCPTHVGGGFHCGYNNQTSLEFCPTNVGRGFSCNDNPIYSVVSCFIERDDRETLIELFNDVDIVRGDNIIYDRLKWFYEEIGVDFTDEILKGIEKYYFLNKR